jgi:hypothetical protein
LKADEFIALFNSRIDLASIHEGQSTTEMGHCVIGIKLQRLVEILHCSEKIILSAARFTPADISVDVAWLPVNNDRQVGDCFAKHSHFKIGRRPLFEGASVRWVQPNSIGEVHRRLVELLPFGMCPAPEGVKLAILRIELDCFGKIRDGQVKPPAQAMQETSANRRKLARRAGPWTAAIRLAFGRGYFDSGHQRYCENESIYGHHDRFLSFD